MNRVDFPGVSGHKFQLERRSFLRGATAFGAMAAAGPAFAGQTASLPASVDVKSAPDAIKVIVSLSQQRLEVYRGASLITSEPISSGRRGHTTPAGIFSVLEKRKRHFSNLYNNAPMPYMQRLTWSGIALHEGRLPGHPASHGCIRLRRGFASELFKMTSRGAHVVVTDHALQGAPSEISHPALFQPLPPPGQSEMLMSDMRGAFPDSGDEAATIQLASLVQPARLIDIRGSVVDLADDEFERARLAAEEKRSDKPLRIIITGRSDRERYRTIQTMLNELGFDAGAVDGIVGRRTRAAIRAFESSKLDPQTGEITETLFRSLAVETGRPEEPNGYMHVRQNMKPVLKAPIVIRDPDQPLGTHMFVTSDFNRFAGTSRWLSVNTHEMAGVDPKSVLDRIEVAPHIQRMMSAMITPGSSMIVSDLGISNRTTPKGTDFIVITR